MCLTNVPWDWYRWITYVSFEKSHYVPQRAIMFCIVLKWSIFIKRLQVDLSSWNAVHVCGLWTKKIDEWRCLSILMYTITINHLVYHISNTLSYHFSKKMSHSMCSSSTIKQTNLIHYLHKVQSLKQQKGKF